MSNSDSSSEEMNEMDLDLSDAGDEIDTENEDALLEQEEHYLESDDSDDDSDTSSDEDEEDKLSKQYLEILEMISEDKTNYDCYVQLIEIAHQISDLEKIRESCELFSAAFPLAPEIWLRWLKIELNISTNESELKRVHQLFRRAFADYFSSTLAIEYANLATKLPHPDDLWEEILSTYALNCTEGRLLFESWRDYLKNTLPESPVKYSKLIDSYERELSIPLKDIEETYIEFKVLCEKQGDKFTDIDWKKIDEKYQKVKDQLAIMLPFENQLNKLGNRDHKQRMETYEKYINECKNIIDERIIQTLYERMVTDCCLSESSWLQYIEFIQLRDEVFKTAEMTASPVFSQTDWDIVNRALRNCTWSAALFIEKMSIAERMELPKQEVQIITESAFAATINSPQSFLKIWLEYISYLKRNTNFNDEKEIENLRANLTYGWESLEKKYADPYCELLKLWGRLEYGPLQNVSKAKELWMLITENDNNVNKSAIWIEFAYLELNKGVDAARKVYRKAISIPNIDDIHTIISAWTRLERCYGTFDQLKLCQKQCNSALEKYYSEKQFQKKKNPSKFNKIERTSKPEKTPKEGSSKDITKEKRNLKRKQNDSQIETNGSKKKKMMENKIMEKKTILPLQPVEKDSVTVFISNLSYDITSDEVIASFPELKIRNVNLITTPNGRGRGFGYIELNDSNEVQLALSFDRRPINGRPAFISNMAREKEHRGKFKYNEELELTKLFVKGLPYDATKEEVEELFGQFGKLKDVRLVCHKNGKPKGIAYIEYEDESVASKVVLKMDKYDLRNLTLSVSISDPPKSKKNIQSNVSGLGQGRRNNINKGDQKPRLSFIPRAVQQNVMDRTSTSTQVQARPEIKSNDDFRKLLFK